MGARVCQTPDWPGFGPQKNRALDLATGDWVFSIDADERVTPRAARADPRPRCARRNSMPTRVSRRSSYCGQYMAHSGWHPDSRRAAGPARATARFSDALVHEALAGQRARRPLRGRAAARQLCELRGGPGQAQPLFHGRCAATCIARASRARSGKALGHGLWAFLRTYVLQARLPGWPLGLGPAVSNAEGTYYRYSSCGCCSADAAGCPRP